jgi:hypothetical protein
MLNPDDDTPIDALEAMYEDAALAAADDPSQITPQDRAAADALRLNIEARIAERRRSFLPDGKIKTARPIRPSYLAMGRQQLLTRLQELVQRLGPQLQIAHRKLTELTDNDLRRLLETINADPEEP